MIVVATSDNHAMQPHVRAATSSAVRQASYGEQDASVRLVGTGVALGLLALVAHVFGRPATKGSRTRRR